MEAERAGGGRRRRGGILAAVTVACALAAAAPAGAATPIVPSSFFGVASQSSLDPAEIARMAEGQIGTLRVIVNWGTIDPTSAPGDSNWAQIDPLVAEAARNGIEVLPFFFGTPNWVATDLDGRRCRPPACGLHAPSGPEAISAWQAFVTEAVTRYGPGGEFWALNPSVPLVPITTWQIWNEQNSPTFYQPKPDPRAYANLVATSSEAIRARDPAATILLGGVFGTPGGERKPKLFAHNYLRRVYRVPGIEQRFDGVAVHPYAGRLRGVAEQVELLRDEIKRAGDDAELWVTEVGWSSGTGENPLERGERGQARRLREAMRWFLVRAKPYRIANVTWFAWRDLAGAPICEWCPGAGLFEAGSLTAKPAWQALMNFTGGR